MKVFLHFSQSMYKSMYNCEVIVKDTAGKHNYFVNLVSMEADSFEFLEIEAASGDFVLTVLPQMADYKSMMAEAEIANWKDKLAKKIGNAICSLVDTMMLRVGCTYNISGVKDMDTIYLSGQEYVFGKIDGFDLLGLLPVFYMFFEASCQGHRCEMLDAFAMNRKQVISSSRALALSCLDLDVIFTYPVQVGRVKLLTSNKKVKKTLLKFNRMNEEQRQKVLNKKENL